MNKAIDYGTLMHKAMRTLIFDVLKDVEQSGLPGEHHFFITFDTTVEGVEISEWLRQRYPEEMTIVIQHWFDGLNVKDDGFDITLNFGDQPESLVVPFLAILTFVDPSVEFGLRFEQNEDDEQPKFSEMEKANDQEKKSSKQKGDVVSLDSFRK
ncbi:MAG: ClpXP protease specificity-enhancing factor SspB [Paracoccaceae bacterium]|nr:ClpXP protease specificity-enhancing factor SspB [Paracoccaceae bacterium]